MPVPKKEIDALLKGLAEKRDEYANDVSAATRKEWMEFLLKTYPSVAQDWATTATLARGYDEKDPDFDSKVGEELASNPYPVCRGVQLTIAALTEAAKQEAAGGEVILPPAPNGKFRRVEGTKYSAYTENGGVYAALAHGGMTEEVWFELGADGELTENATRGGVYTERAAAKAKGGRVKGKVAVVLGAGNVNAIPVRDTIAKMIHDNYVVLLKLNPVVGYSLPFIEKVFAPIIEAGYLAVINGGGDVGAYLTNHELVEDVHITGAEATFDRIVWGPPEEQARRKAENDPTLKDKTITGELGNVSPWIIVPGKWSASDIEFYAQSLVGSVMVNASFACAAPKIVVTSAHWPQREAFLDAIRKAGATTTSAAPYYPGAKERSDEFRELYADRVEDLNDGDQGTVSERSVPISFVPGLDASADERIFEWETFVTAFGEVPLGHSGGMTDDGIRAFAESAARFCNEGIHGQLVCTVAVNPGSAKILGPGLDQMVAELNYGLVAVNAPTLLGYTMPVLPWGAAPGNKLDNIGSGNGWVHNGHMFDTPAKSVLRAPFRLLGVGFIPLFAPWLNENPSTGAIGRAMSDIAMHNSWGPVVRLLGITVKDTVRFFGYRKRRAAITNPAPEAPPPPESK